MTTPQDAVSTENVMLTKADLNALLAELAAAKMPPPIPGAADPVPAAQYDEWTPNELLHAIVSRVRWHTEREVLSAYAAVDALYPVEA